MKKLLLLSLFSVLCMQIQAQKRTEQQMRSVAQNVLKHAYTGELGNNKLNVMMSKSMLNVYGYEGGGFVVIAKDRRFKEVIGYSLSDYSDSIPCGFKWWLETVNENMSKAISSSLDTRILMANRTGVSPMITTSWGQSRPYNDNCTFTYNNHTYQCVTGCVATALAQVMNYYKYPESGTGSISYDVTYNNSFNITYAEDFSQSYYDWNNMLDSYASYSNTSNVDNYTRAVAKLMKDCGVATRTSFSDGSHGSSSSLHYANDALKTFFSYTTTNHYKRSDYDRETWMNMIYNELDKGRPILYGGTSGQSINSTGHAFVIHGYDSSGLVYINWGWDGRYEGYFDIDMLNPSNKQYNYNQEMVIAVPQQVTHILNVSAYGSGSVACSNNNGVEVRNGSQSFDVIEGDNVIITLRPDQGCQVDKLYLNNQDVTASLTNNRYTIDNIQSDITVIAEFISTGSENPSSQDNVLGIFIELYNGQKLEYRLTDHPKLKFDGQTIILTADGVLVEYIPSQLLKVTTGEVQTITDVEEKRIPNGDIKVEAGFVRLSGFASGELVRVYSVGGTMMSTYSTMADGSLVIPVSILPSGISIIKIKEETIKITKR